MRIGHNYTPERKTNQWKPTVITSYSIHYTKLYDSIPETAPSQPSEKRTQASAWRLRSSHSATKTSRSNGRPTGFACSISRRATSKPTVITSYSIHYTKLYEIGVGIDYALFVVTRFREGLAAGWSVEQSVVTAVTTAGRAVAFAGVVVLVALLGLYAIGIPFVANLGLSAAIVVGLAVVVALTILPALLAVVGRNIDSYNFV